MPDPTMVSNTATRWRPTSSLPDPKQVAAVRYPDGVVDYQLWTGEEWFPLRAGPGPIAWLPIERLSA